MMKLPRFVFPALMTFAAAVVMASPAVRQNIPDGQVEQWVGQRVVQWQPQPEERRFDEIGWAKDLRSARQLAAKHNRPIFLFTMDGRINIGRC